MMSSRSTTHFPYGLLDRVYCCDALALGRKATSIQKGLTAYNSLVRPPPGPTTEGEPEDQSVADGLYRDQAGDTLPTKRTSDVGTLKNGRQVANSKIFAGSHTSARIDVWGPNRRDRAVSFCQSSR